MADFQHIPVDEYVDKTTMTLFAQQGSNDFVRIWSEVARGSWPSHMAHFEKLTPAVIVTHRRDINAGRGGFLSLI